MTWATFFQLLGAVLPVVSVLAAVWLTNRHNARMARQAQDSAAAVAQSTRAFEARERRYEARRIVVLSFLNEADKFTDRIDEAKWDGPDADLYFGPGVLPEALTAGPGQIDILCPPPVSEAARAFLKALADYYLGESEAWPSLQAARRIYVERARAMLAEEALIAPGELIVKEDQ